LIHFSVYATIREAVEHHPDADVVVNFASFRSAYDVTMESIKYPNIKTVAIIAEGIPENQTRKLIIAAKEKNVTIIGEPLTLK
jgi:ATP citrate (pro-S)-lyase